MDVESNLGAFFIVAVDKVAAGPVRDGVFLGQERAPCDGAAQGPVFIGWRFWAGGQFRGMNSRMRKPEASAKRWDAPEAAVISIKFVAEGRLRGISVVARRTRSCRGRTTGNDSR